MPSVCPDDLLDLLGGLIAGGQGASGVAVRVVQVQHVDADVVHQAGLPQHGCRVTEVPCGRGTLASMTAQHMGGSWPATHDQYTYGYVFLFFSLAFSLFLINQNLFFKDKH